MKLLFIMAVSLLSVSGWAQTAGEGLAVAKPFPMVIAEPYTPPCPPGFILGEIRRSAWDGEIGCVHDPKYWYWQQPRVTLSDITGEDPCFVVIHTGGWQRIDSMWTMRVDSIADTVPVWRRLRLMGGSGVVMVIDYQSPADSIFVPDEILVQVGDIRSRVDTTWVPKE